MAIIPAYKQKWASLLDRRLRRVPSEHNNRARQSRPVSDGVTKVSNKKACQRSAFRWQAFGQRSASVYQRNSLLNGQKEEILSSFEQLARRISRECHLQKNSKGLQLVVLVVTIRMLTEISFCSLVKEATSTVSC